MLTQSNKKQLKQFKNQSQAGYMQSNEPQITGGEAGKQNRIKTHSQSGRSMIEMLGVLAIIGVLSIGGIVGYKLAMNHYQASQIAHEMNMMRTDAQIKIAQGAEELMLGDPYDSGNIQFNGYKTDFDCLYLETETSAPDDVASCAVANAYYIEMQKIPEGICKPLANLIDKMDNEIAFYINGKSVDAEEEKGACIEGINTLKVIFGADSDSEAIKCNDDSDCPDNLICLNHMCVECETDEDCPYNTDYCKNNVCKTCENGVWGGQNKGCVECTTNDDCENPTTPYCNPTSNKCAPCENDSQCDTAQNEHCKTSIGECVVCDANKEVWDNDLKECRPAKSCEELKCDPVTGKYCRSTCSSCDSNGQESASYCTFICANTDTQQKKTVGNITYYYKSSGMNWWTADRYCKALKAQGKVTNGTLVSLEELGCPAGKTGSDVCVNGELRQKLNSSDNGDSFIGWAWTSTPYNDTENDSCGAYHVGLSNGCVHNYTRTDYYTVLCE